MKTTSRALFNIPNFMWKPLILPFCVLALVCLFLARAVVSWNGILTNLAATFIGILITVLYVEYILRKHEEQRWAPAQTLINKYIQSFAIVSSAMFRVIFGKSSDIFNIAAIDVNNPDSMRTEMIRALEENVLPAVDGGVRRMSKEKWKFLVVHLQLTQERGDRLLQLYAARINPELLGRIMTLKDEISNLQAVDTMLPDEIGAPWTGLKGLEDGALENVIGSGIKRICEASAALMRGLGT